MIFDDHDIRDDWNTSLSWKKKMEATSWWHGRIVAGLASYWVYQHLGNLSPQERAEDAVWQRIIGHTTAGMSSMWAPSWTASRSGLIGTRNPTGGATAATSATPG